jgi:hypothetical protein
MRKRVYISSATKELEKYRQEAVKVIESLGMEAVYQNKGFDIGADPYLTLLEQNERVVQSCDAFIGIYGYGWTWVPIKGEPKLISEYELEWARKNKVPCFCYVPRSIHMDSVEGLVIVQRSDRMEDFTNWLQDNHAVGFLTTLDAFAKHLRRQLENLTERVFLSYSRKDTDFVLWLRDELKRDNYAAWRDGDTIPPSTDWEKELRAGLERCELMVLALSPDAVKSKYVRWEFEEFSKMPDKHFFLVETRTFRDYEHQDYDTPTLEFIQNINRWQTIDAKKHWGEAYKVLVKAIEDVLRKPTTKT